MKLPDEFMPREIVLLMSKVAPLTRRRQPSLCCCHRLQARRAEMIMLRPRQRTVSSFIHLIMQISASPVSHTLAQQAEFVLLFLCQTPAVALQSTAKNDSITFTHPIFLYARQKHNMKLWKKESSAKLRLLGFFHFKGVGIINLLRSFERFGHCDNDAARCYGIARHIKAPLES